MLHSEGKHEIWYATITSYSESNWSDFRDSVSSEANIYFHSGRHKTTPIVKISLALAVDQNNRRHAINQHFAFSIF